MNALTLPDLQRAPERDAHVRDRLSRPLRDLRLSVIEACNFRCPYCMPPEHAAEHFDDASRLDSGEIETLVRAFVRNGVTKLRLTGGEPLLRRDLAGLVARLAGIAGLEDLALTTNGSLLARHARALRDAGLRRLTISLDALEPELFRRLSGGRGELADVLAGIDEAEAAGFRQIKFNCVVQRGVNESQVLPLVERFRHTGHVVRFIEYMDVGTCNGWDRARVVPSAELRDLVDARWPMHPLDANYRGEVARRHAFLDGGGEVGFISSVTAPFCGDCHRARVSADGRLYACLFAGTGSELRGAIRQGEVALAERIADIWSGRADRYSELRGRGGSRKHVEMFLVGG